jgi:hypothetical protein
MATLTSKLTLVGTAAEFGAPLSLTVSGNHTVEAPFSSPSRKSIGTAAAVSISSDLETSQVVATYVYLKNMDTANVITISTSTATETFLTLEPEGFAFFPLKSGVGLKAVATTTACVLEYAYYSKS